LSLTVRIDLTTLGSLQVAMPVLQLQAAVSAGEQRAAHALAQRSATEPLKTALKPTDARWMDGDNGPTYTKGLVNIQKTIENGNLVT
jgi:hypothetical protein